MSNSVAVEAALLTHAHHPNLGFWRTYIFSLDHKMIGRQFLFFGFFMLLIGGMLAIPHGDWSDKIDHTCAALGIPKAEFEQGES